MEQYLNDFIEGRILRVYEINNYELKELILDGAKTVARYNSKEIDERTLSELKEYADFRITLVYEINNYELKELILDGAKWLNRKYESTNKKY